MVKKKTSVTLSEEVLDLLQFLAEKYALSRSAILEVIIRDRAKIEKVNRHGSLSK